MKYFVTLDGVEISSHLTRSQALKIANEKYEETKSTLRIGIGKIKYNTKGKAVFACLPMHFYNH